jgi:hypothetical protein
MSLKFVMPILVIPRADYKYIALDSLALGQAQVILSDYLDVSLAKKCGPPIRLRPFRLRM